MVWKAPEGDITTKLLMPAAEVWWGNTGRGQGLLCKPGLK